MSGVLGAFCLPCFIGRLPFDNGKVSEFKIPDDATMIQRTNSLDYKFNMPSLRGGEEYCDATDRCR